AEPWIKTRTFGVGVAVGVRWRRIPIASGFLVCARESPRTPFSAASTAAGCGLSGPAVASPSARPICARARSSVLPTSAVTLRMLPYTGALKSRAGAPPMAPCIAWTSSVCHDPLRRFDDELADAAETVDVLPPGVGHGSDRST